MGCSEKDTVQSRKTEEGGVTAVGEKRSKTVEWEGMTHREKRPRKKELRGMVH